ncbi:MAG: NHL repeat-containing protein [Coriobacteriia bacterium]|nr:NHL repeat-containing protein [Coriobacteriia bacterium]
MAADAIEAAAPSRARIILIVAILLLLALLAGLLVVFYNLVKPGGTPQGEQAADELRWERSMYGFGPSPDEQLQLPSSVAIAPNGDVYATDPMRARIMIFRSDGTFRRLLHTGAGGTGPRQFIRPEAIDIDAEGDLYIADSWANKIIVFDAQGLYVREWPVEVQARGVGVTDDRVYVLDTGRVLVFDKQGTKLAGFGERGPQPGQIDAYQGITGKDGFIYVAEPFNKRISAFTQDGDIKWVVPGGLASRGGPSRDATGTDGSASDAVPGHRWDLPQDLVFDAAGRLIVVDAFLFEVAVVDPKTGKVTAVYGDFGRNEGEFFYPTSIDYDPQRDWFAIADTNNNRVQIVRIPGSANPGAAALWRATSSPFRYLAVPLGLLLLAIGLGLWSGRALLRRRAPLTDSV